MQCALKITCVFSVIIHQNIDAKSTENPATWRTARMHDLGLPICCCQNHIQKKHPVRGVLSFALTPRSGGLGYSYMRWWLAGCRALLLASTVCTSDASKFHASKNCEIDDVILFNVIDRPEFDQKNHALCAVLQYTLKVTLALAGI